MGDMYLLIATSGRATLLERTLTSIAACQRPAHFAGVIVIENGSPCGSESVCQRGYGTLNVRYRWSRRPNKSHALNVAMEEIPDDSLILFSDDDIRFEPQTLMVYAQAAASADRGTFFGGPFGCDYETVPLPYVVPYLPLSAVGWQPDPATFNAARDRFLGFNWAAFSGDIKSLGGFDPNFGPGSPTGATGQETNMQRRMHQAGMRSMLLPQALVHHFVPESRCSIDWTIERARRNGISRGCALRSRSVVEIAMGHWTNSVRLLFSSATRLASHWAPDSPLHFRACCDQQRSLGYFRGFRADPASVNFSSEDAQPITPVTHQSRRAA